MIRLLIQIIGKCRYFPVKSQIIRGGMNICSRLINELAPAWQYAEAKETFAVYFLVVDDQCLKN